MIFATSVLARQSCFFSVIGKVLEKFARLAFSNYLDIRGYYSDNARSEIFDNENLA
jgi:hypothetical protein